MANLDPLDTEILTAHVLQRDRTWWRAHPEKKLTAKQKNRLERLLWQRRAGIPIAYLIGQKEFYGRSFMVGPGVLIPRPETELIIEEALRQVPLRSTGLMADIGTGSGCLAVTLAVELRREKIIATDLSAVALSAARRNAKRHRVQSRIQFRRGNLLEPLSDLECRRLGVVVANLPYLTPKEIRAVPHEPRLALVAGSDGLTAFRNFFRQAKQKNIHALMLLEIDPRRTQLIVRLAQKTFPAATVRVLKDLAGRNRIVSVEPR